MDIDDSLITQCLNELFQKQSRIKTYFDYYNGNSKILNEYQRQDNRANHVVNVNFAKRFVDNMCGYFLAKPITYISKSGDENITKAIDANCSIWEKEHNLTLSKFAELAGESYEAVYIDRNGAFKAQALNPLNTYIIEDGTDERNVVFAINLYWKPFDFSHTFADVYTDTDIIHYQIGSYTGQGGFTLVGRTPHIFGRVPVVVFPANYERESGIADIISLNDAYNQVVSDSINTIADNRLAYLTVTGATVDPGTLQEMKQGGVINIPDGAKVDYLIKEINDSFTKETADRIRQEIYATQDSVDLSLNNFSSNTSGVAIGSTLLQLSNRVGIRESFFEKALKQRLTFLFTYLSIAQNVKYDVNDISIHFTNNLPTDLVSMADALSKLETIVPQSTLLAQLPFVENPDNEIKKFKTEQEDKVPVNNTIVRTQSQNGNEID